MRNYTITWEEEKNAIILEPRKENTKGKYYELTRENIVTYVLTSGETKISSTLDGCIEYLSEYLEKEDLLTFASFLYSWGQYNGARMN